MTISIETPVFKGGWLRRCIDSVLYQSSPDWTFSLVWDGGDAESRGILEALDRRKLPNVTVYFEENRGIARARHFLSERSKGDLILPLDDDDALPFHAVERFLEVARQKPWASIIRGQRKIIDEEGKVLNTPPWFAFEPRHYQNGMVTDLNNHTQPSLMRRSAYERTSGWEGFEDFRFAGEDCDVYLKLEENGAIELLDEVLYYYRVHSTRASLWLTEQGAYEMWRRLADKTIARIGLPLKRLNDKPPYRYERLPRPAPTLAMVDFVIVTDQGAATRPLANRMVEVLTNAGVSADATHVVEGRAVAGLSRCLRQTTRPIVCVMSVGVELSDAQPIEKLLRLMHEGDADLAAPKLVATNGATVWADPGFDETRRPSVGHHDRGNHRPGGTTSAPWLSERLALIRREVVNAVGGIDEGYDDERLAIVDLCLKARQRQFKCVSIDAVSLVCRSDGGQRDDGGDMDRLRAKWTVYPQLFE